MLNRNGQILGTHETLPKYMSQARDANLHHSDWLKSPSRVPQNSCIRAVPILMSHIIFTTH